MTSKINSQTRTGFALFFTILLFYLIFTKVNFRSVLRVLDEADFRWLSITILFSFVIVLIRASRFWLFLKLAGHNVSLKESFYLVMAAAPLNTITPSKSGDISIAYYLKGKVPMSETIGVILAERVLDLFILALLALSALFFVGQGKLSPLIIVILVVPLIVLVILASRHVENSKLKNLLSSLKLVTRDKKIFLSVSCYSLLIWLLSIFQTAVLFLSVGVDVPLFSVMAYTPIAILIGMIPVTLGGMGTRDSAILLLFSGFAEPSRLLSVGILFSFVRYWLIAVVGLPFMRVMLKNSQ